MKLPWETTESSHMSTPIHEVPMGCAHISIDCDWTEAQIKELAEKIKSAL